MDKENLIKLFRKYSSQSDDNLLPLVNEYISTGKRRILLLKSICLVILIAVLTGALAGILKMLLNIEHAFLSSGVVGGIIGGISVLFISSALRRDIREYLKSKENKIL